jgi:hypothetical protein
MKPHRRWKFVRRQETSSRGWILLLLPRRKEKGEQPRSTTAECGLPHINYPCPPRAQCYFGDGLKRFTTAYTHCLIWDPGTLGTGLRPCSGPVRTCIRRYVESLTQRRGKTIDCIQVPCYAFGRGTRGGECLRCVGRGTSPAKKLHPARLFMALLWLCHGTSSRYFTEQVISFALGAIMVSEIEGILRWPVFRLSKICMQIAGGGWLDSSQESTAAAVPP